MTTFYRAKRSMRYAGRSYAPGATIAVAPQYAAWAESLAKRGDIERLDAQATCPTGESDVGRADAAAQVPADKQGVVDGQPLDVPATPLVQQGQQTAGQPAAKPAAKPVAKRGAKPAAKTVARKTTGKAKA